MADNPVIVDSFRASTHDPYSFDEANAIAAAAQEMIGVGIEIKLPWNCDLDDLERSQFDGLVAACRAYSEGLLTEEHAKALPEEETKLCDMEGVREYAEGLPVELWRSEEGRLVICAQNEAGENCTLVDLWDLIDWLRVGQVKEGRRAVEALLLRRRQAAP